MQLARPRLHSVSAASLRPALAVAGGLATWTSFPPLSWWWAAPLGVAALVLAVHGRRSRAAAAIGFGYGLAMFLPMLSFLRGLGADAWLVVSFVESLWFAGLAVALAVVSRRRWWPFAVPVVWLAVEFARDRWPWGGFPWGRLAFGQASGPWLPLAAWAGAPLVAAAVLASASGFAWAVVAGRHRRLPAAVAAVLPLVASLALAALVTVPTRGTSRAGAASHVVVAAVQGDVPRLGLDAFEQRRVVTENHLRETQRLAAEVAAGRVRRPDLVIWPENASDEDPFTDPVARQMVQTAVAAAGVPVVVGAVIDGPDARHVQNVAVLWSAAGPGERYVKRHLVPFGEYLPLRDVLTKLIGRFSLIPRDFSPGRRPGVMSAPGVRFGDVICYEVADDGVVRDSITGGGRLLVVQTNNATYERVGDSGRGGETAQQLAMSQLRAVEHGRAVVVAATSGVSAVISPDGRIQQRTRVFVPAALIADVPLRDPLTVSDRLGAWPERLLALLGALCVAAATRGGRRERPQQKAPAAPELAGAAT